MWRPKLVDTLGHDEAEAVNDTLSDTLVQAEANTVGDTLWDTVVVYLTFTHIYGGIITHSFITCKVHVQQSAKAFQLVLWFIPKKSSGEWIIT